MLELNRVYKGDCMKLLKQLPDNSIDLVLTDPPYGMKYISGRRKFSMGSIFNDDKFFLPLEELKRVVKTNGCIFFFYSHKFPFVEKEVKNVIVWVKNNWSSGDLKGDFGNQYELIAYMPMGNFKLHGKRYSNVWKFNRIDGNSLLHPTQKPIDLMRRLVSCGSWEGDVVLDPFAGSGSTLVAAKQLNRNFIGFELSQKYCDIANKRLEQRQLRETIGTVL